MKSTFILVIISILMGFSIQANANDSTEDSSTTTTESTATGDTSSDGVSSSDDTSSSSAETSTDSSAATTSQPEPIPADDNSGMMLSRSCLCLVNQHLSIASAAVRLVTTGISKLVVALLILKQKQCQLRHTYR